MTCGFCKQTTAPMGMRWTTGGERLIVLQCSNCQAILGAAHSDLSDRLERLERLVASQR
jgi:hypothetical protein